MLEKLKTKWLQFLHSINPCEKDEEHFLWQLFSTLFPECWCCAGVRGIIYGFFIWVPVGFLLALAFK